MYAMRTATIPSTAYPQAPTLRLLPKTGRSSTCSGRGQLRVLSGPPPSERPVLVAGSDAGACAAMQQEIARTMPPHTHFATADAIWELLVRAADACMVVLSGEIEEMPSEAILQMLAHKHPGLPVVSVDA
jgi:hypothetical protein